MESDGRQQENCHWRLKNGKPHNIVLLKTVTREKSDLGEKIGLVIGV